MKFDVIVIGAGAAGLFCASIAGRRGRSVLVIERAEKVGKKILISGGGRCNFTNLYADADNYLSARPNFHKSALARYTPADFIALVERHGIAYHEKKLGQLFCDHSSREIVQLLLDECAEAQVSIRVNCEVRRVRKNGSFIVETSQGSFAASSLVVATGGLSIPKMGATDFGYRLARQFGLRIVEPKPALVPLTLAEGDLRSLSELSGISVDALVSCRGQQFRENILLTHRGLSGPAILQISSYWNAGDTLTIDLLPDQNARALLFDHQRENISLSTLLSQRLPQRFARAWTALYAQPKPLRQFNARELETVAQRLHQWQVRPDGTEGFGKAEVTKGGVDTDELSSKTMEARKVPGLCLIGEVVDVTGWLGGYNFQWAWASGYAAGQYV
ncbi:MAG TPA: NAD(P)/FAD-dependent oxidoreductase [Blastocatellia bacterium]|nr:NAD(P)/FAD-dependent oxidoreductase [Blastocatellia bacterium]